MERAYSLLTVKGVDEDQRTIKGVATTPTPDRVGDIVEPLGVQFKNPMPLLWQHQTSEPVGQVRFSKPTKNGIEFEASFPRPTVSKILIDRVDEAWESVKLNLVRGVSIGFRAIEKAFIDDGGIRFTKSEVLELSLVTIPMNQDATIQTIKSIDAPLLAASGNKQESGPPGPVSMSAVLYGKTIPCPPKAQQDNPPGVTGKTTVSVAPKDARNMKKTIADQIGSFEATRAAKAARMDEIMDVSGEKGETLDTDQSDEYDGIVSEVKKIDEHLVRLRAAEQRNIEKAVPAVGSTPEKAAELRSGTIVQVKNTRPPGFGFAYLLSARYMAKEDGGSAAEIAQSRGWGDDVVSVLRTPKHVLKTAINAANTTDSTWAGPLVVYQNLQNELIELMRPMSIINRIPGLRRVPFNIKVPRETGTTTAYWVPQGSPKPVSKGAFDTVTLDFAKVAGITFQTQELLRFSQPNSEQLMVNSLTEAITYLVDRDFLDPAKVAVTGESPASITRGSTAIASTGTTADAFRANFRSLMAAYTLANYKLSGLVLVMTSTQAMSLGEMRTDFGQPEFPNIDVNGGSISGIPVITSENIVATGGSPADGAIIVAMNPRDILLADDGNVDVDISTEASLQTDSAPDSPATTSTIMLSLWQRNMVAIRCERYITWTKARTHSVVYISGANYH